MKLWQDSNGDGLVDSGDVQLGQGKFNSDDGGLRLELTNPLNLSQPVNLLVTVDISSRLVLNFTILMAFGLFGLGIVRRFQHNRYLNRGLTFILVLTLLALVSCGGQTATGPTQPTPSKQETFQLTLESAEAIVPSSNTLNIIGLPITGTNLTVTE